MAISYAAPYRQPTGGHILRQARHRTRKRERPPLRNIFASSHQAGYPEAGRRMLWGSTGRNVVESRPWRFPWGQYGRDFHGKTLVEVPVGTLRAGFPRKAARGDSRETLRARLPPVLPPRPLSLSKRRACRSGDTSIKGLKKLKTVEQILELKAVIINFVGLFDLMI